MPDILITLFIIAILPIVLSMTAGYFRIKELGQFDNNHPRAQQAQLTGAGARAIAAQKNAWEALIFFAVVVLIAANSSLDLNQLDNLAYTFLAARLLHPIFYITNQPTLRSLVFAIGWFTCIYIFYLTLMQY